MRQCNPGPANPRQFPPCWSRQELLLELQIYRQLAAPVARLFRGERPQDIPVVQPTTFEFVINLRTAKGLRLTIPEALLIRADKVIE
jgi:ABC-type uncharacterized transport system substrate-binding protein